MQRPTVSVIIPVYNGLKHIETTLDTVLQQTHPADEIIVIDDGSTDGSVELLERLGAELPITVIHQPNAGQSAARNTAAKLATSELLAFVDHDDQWYPKHLEKLTRCFIDKPDVGWAYSDFDEFDERGLIVTRRFINAHGLDHPKMKLTDFLQHDAMIVPSASIIRASAYEGVGGFDPRLSGYEYDDLFIRLFRAGWKAKFLNESLTRFRVHPGSSSGRESFQRSRLLFLDKLIEEFPNNPRLNRHYIRDLVLPRLFRSTLGEYNVALSMGDMKQAKRLSEVLTQINKRSPGGPRRALELAFIRRPRLVRVFLGAYRLLPRSLRPEISSSLTSGILTSRL